MPSGGARNRTGNLPDPGSLRQKSEWTTLPTAGRGVAPAPRWPLVEPTTRELELWRVLWRKPQAMLWEAGGQSLEVAIHVRQLVVAERHGAAQSSRLLLRQQMDSLMLTLPAMRAARILIGTPAPAAAKAKTRASSSVRERLSVVPDSAG